MYIKHFGLTQYPFSLTPNTRFFLKLPAHQEAFNQLIKVLEIGEPLSEVIGEVGTGKTMLCRKLINTLEFYPERYVTMFLPNPMLDENDAMLALADELKLNDCDNMNYRELLKAVSKELTQLAAQDKRIVLLIDEAQAIPEDTIRAIHLLTQLDAPNNRSLQIVMFGQPELKNLFKQATLSKLQEQLGFTYELPKLSRQEMEDYVQLRLEKAGYGGPAMFTKESLDLIFKASQGVPRLINILCHKSMMVAFGKGELSVTAEYVDAASEDSDALTARQGWRRRLFPRPDS